MSHNLAFDMTNRWVRWALYVYHNRRHDGEIWFAYKSPHGVLLTTELRDCDLLGEVRSRVIDGKFVDDIIPLQQRSPAELARLHEQSMAHRRYRAELYKRYSLAERLADLGGKDFVPVKRDKPN